MKYGLKFDIFYLIFVKFKVCFDKWIFLRKRLLIIFSNVYVCIENNIDKINEIFFFLNLSNYIMLKKVLCKENKF